MQYLAGIPWTTPKLAQLIGREGKTEKNPDVHYLPLFHILPVPL